MDRKAECTQKDQEIPLLQLQGATHTQQIQTQNGDHHTDPQFGTHLLSEEQAQDGNNDDVQCRNKPSLSHRGILYTHLLQAGGNPQCQATENSPQKKRLSLGSLLSASLLTFHPAKNQNRRDQGKATHQGTNGIEGKWSNVVHSHRLGHESRAPDKGSQEQQQQILCRELIHASLSTLLYRFAMISLSFL